MNLILDSEAFSYLARSADTARPTSRTRAAIRAALEEDDEVLVPAAVLAEAYRGGPHDQVVDACLNRFPAIVVVDTTRSLAREIGHVLARAGRSSADHVDAAVVAAAVQAGGGVIATSDVADLTALAEGRALIRVEAV